MNEQLFLILANLPTIIATVERVRGAGKGKIKKEDVRNVVLTSTLGMELSKKLTVKNRAAFNKNLDKAIDGLVGVLNAAEWKREEKEEKS